MAIPLATATVDVPPKTKVEDLILGA